MADVRYHEAAPFLGPPPDAESSLEQIEEWLKHLELQREIALKLIIEKKAMDQAMDPEVENYAIPDDTQEEIPARVVVAFVKELEEAHRFFDLKDYLREHKEFKELDYGSPNIFQYLVDKVESDNIFDNYEEAIWKAVRNHITEVRVQIYRKTFTAYLEKRVQEELSDMFGESDEYTTAQRDAVYTLFPGLRYVEPRPSLDLSNPVVKLVHETREKKPVYDMDEDPKVELRKIEESNPMFYHTQFICQHVPCPPKNTVTVSNLRPVDTILHVEELLKSCGKILQYEEERGIRKALMIHVTFKNASGARRALGMKSPSIDGKPVMITTPQSAPNRLKPEDIKAPNADEALLKYRELRVWHKKKANAVQVVSGANYSGTNAIKTAAKRGKKKKSKSNASRVKNS